MAGKTVKKSGAAATARTPIVRKAVKGTPGYMQPTLASKAKAMRRPLVQEEDPGWFDVMHRVAAWVVSLEPCFEGTEEDFMSRASSINVPYGDHEKLHSDSSRVHPLPPRSLPPPPPMPSPLEDAPTFLVRLMGASKEALVSLHRPHPPPPPPHPSLSPLGAAPTSRVAAIKGCTAALISLPLLLLLFPTPSRPGGVPTFHAELTRSRTAAFR
ncbi:hypothetical protein BDZ91DRAFT_803394 [Kalaharituber pfeilii]|nr:hypothetical protein BDZ91DRAFT_803394 [Kalaharituber pfeilii]